MNLNYFVQNAISNIQHCTLDMRIQSFYVSFQGERSRQSLIQYSCCHCSSILNSQREASRHARTHSGNPYFRIACPVCKQFFTTIQGWSRHLKIHKTGQESELTALDQLEAADAENCELVGEDSQIHQGTDTKEDAAIYDSRKELASLVVRLRAKNVTEGACRDVLEFVHSFTSNAIAEYDNDRSESTAAGPSGRSDGWSEPNVPSLKNCALLLNDVHLEATALKKFDTIEPETVVLGTNENGKQDTFQYISLASQLTQRVNAESGFVIVPPSDRADELRGLQDGTAHRDAGKDSLLLVLYYDGFQVGNPLGNKAKKQTLGGVYCSIGNSEYRGKLSEIFCVLLFQEELLERYSWAQILKPLLVDISHLWQMA